MHESILRLGIVELDTDTRLIVSDGSEILIPEPAKAKLVKIFHNPCCYRYNGSADKGQECGVN